MNDDAALLRRYADEGSEPAFAELVRRHVDLVYGAALRRTGGDPHRAADVAQHVFTTLAQQARKLSGHAVLSAWLHTATRNAALNLMISEQRRKTREREAQALGRMHATDDASPNWNRLRPVLDAAIDDLAEADRAAVVLRFLEQRPFAEVGAALHVTEDAARVRTQRALEKLRTGLARHGITSTSAALAALVAGQPAISAPAGLAAALTSTAVASATASAGITGTALALFMNLKIASTLVATAVVAFGSGMYLGLDRANQTPLPPMPETPQHSKTIAALRRDNVTLRNEVQRLNGANATLTAKLATPPASAPRLASAPAPQAVQPVAKIASDVHKAMLNNLRQISSARDQFQLEYGRPPASIDELVGETKYIRRLLPVDGENYSSLSLLPNQPLTVVTPNGVTVTYDPAGRNTTVPERTPEDIQAAEADKMAIERFTQRVGGPERLKQLESAAKKAAQAYRAAHNGQQPLAPEELIPYFATPQEGADFVEALEIQKETRRELSTPTR